MVSVNSFWLIDTHFLRLICPPSRDGPLTADQGLLTLPLADNSPLIRLIRPSSRADPLPADQGLISAFWQKEPLYIVTDVGRREAEFVKQMYQAEGVRTVYSAQPERRKRTEELPSRNV
jgi:hypothetical protein